MLNYTTHAIESMSDPALMRGMARAIPRSIHKVVDVINLLKTAERFIMPDYGRVFEPGTRRGDFRDLMHLPYPVCAVEYAAPGRVTQPTAAVKQSDYFPTRRIALCVETGDKCVSVFSIFEADVGYWTLAPMCALLDPDDIKIDPDTGLFDCKLVPVIHEVVSRPDYTDAAAMLDLSDEVNAAVEFMMTINCENVKRERIEAPAKLNKKRVASGKLPFSSYWMLDVFKEQAATIGASNGGGSHSSPRMHFRRGHIRRLASGKSTFVRHTMVGSGAAGTIQKTYNIKGGK